MQAAINPALAQVIGAMDVISPVTPEGQPTVAAQVMQAAQQATMPQVAQQAGIAGQIQAMKMQEAQKSLMNAAMQQAQPPAGIESLNPQMSNFAEGGIVGYAEAGVTRESARESVNPLALLLRRLAEIGLPTRAGQSPKQDAIDVETERAMRAPTLEIPIPEIAIEEAASAAPAAPRATAAPAAPKPQAPAPLTSAGLFERAQGRLDQYATEPPTPRSAIQPAIEAGQAEDEYRRQMGLPTAMERISKQEAEFKRLFGDRESLIQRRLAEIESQKQMGGIAAFMKGFRQMKGEPIGSGFARASDSMGAYDTSMRQRTEKLEDLKIELQGLTIERQNALDKMRDDIANGRFTDALKRKEIAQKATNEILLKRAEIDMAQGKVLGGLEEARIRQTQQPGEIERMLGTYQSLLKTNPQAAQEYLDTVGALRGAGRRPPPQELRQRMLEQYADNWEKMDYTEKGQLKNQGIKTYEDYVKYRDRIAGVAPTAAPSGGASSDLLKRADAIVGGR